MAAQAPTTEDLQALEERLAVLELRLAQPWGDKAAYTLQEASQLTGLSETSLRGHVQAGTLPATRVDRRIRFTRVALLAFLDTHTVTH